MTKPEVPKFDDEVAGFRQPMVTSIGILMGFVLAFMANWAIDSDGESALETGADFAVAGTLALAMLGFVVTLYRLLDNRIRPHPGQRYRLTLQLYLLSIACCFVGLGAALLL
jgi:protein-S-isoprenylcysteine O-methyltransferase Ste14